MRSATLALFSLALPIVTALPLEEAAPNRRREEPLKSDWVWKQWNVDGSADKGEVGSNFLGASGLERLKSLLEDKLRSEQPQDLQDPPLEVTQVLPTDNAIDGQHDEVEQSPGADDHAPAVEAPSPPTTPEPPPAPAPATPEPRPAPPASGPPSSNGASDASVPPNARAGFAAANALRAQHGARAMAWDATLANMAQAWADKCQFSHGGTDKSRPTGQNLWQSSRAMGPDDDYLSPSVDAWYGEEGLYGQAVQYGEPTSGQMQATFAKWGHFTQLVWKGTGLVGCAKNEVVCPNQITLVVCNYREAGNTVGLYADNVKPKGTPLEG